MSADRSEPPKLRKKKALIALDESDQSSYALKWALDHVLSEGDSVLLLYSQLLPPSYMLETAPSDNCGISISPSESLFGAGLIMSPEVLITFRKQQEQTSSRIFSSGIKLCQEYKISPTTMIAEGDPRETICEAVLKTEADLLIMGSHGYGVLKRAFLGSVSDYCAHNVKCPLLIVKQPH